MSFTEDTFEQAVIELFENMGYTHIYAPDRTDYSSPNSGIKAIIQESEIELLLPDSAILNSPMMLQ